MPVVEVFGVNLNVACWIPWPHYYFWVYALDDELDLEPGLDRRALLKRIEDHVIEQARVVGTYEH